MKKLIFILLVGFNLNLGAQTITLQDLKDYQEYCYNDSSKTSGYVFFENDYGGHYEYMPHYTHKTPTFEGFIEWMEKAKYRIEGDAIIIEKGGNYIFDDDTLRLLIDTLYFDATLFMSDSIKLH